MDAVWVLEGLLTNPTLVEAIGHGKPRKAPPAAAVHVFESIVAHVLQAWQGHKGQDDPKAGLRQVAVAPVASPHAAPMRRCPPSC